MEDNYFVMPETDGRVLKNLAAMGSHLKKLKGEVIAAEEVLKAAQKEYDYYASTILPGEMQNAGVSEIALLDGGRIKMKDEFHCSPNKNDADKKIIADWLRARGGADLVKEKASVDKAQIPLLSQNSIPYTEICDFNTNSLKAFIKEVLGYGKTGQASASIDEVPAPAHFSVFQTVEVEF